MPDDNSAAPYGEFDATLRAASDELAGQATPLPAAAVRARGDSRRTRRRVTATLVAAAATAVVVTGAHALAGPGGSRDVLPAAPTSPTSPTVRTSEASPPTTPSPSPSPTPGTSSPSATPSAPESATPGSGNPVEGSGPSSSAPADNSCRSLGVPAATKSAVTAAFRANTGLTHVTPVAGTFYYGTCGTTAYAASRFRPTSGATLAEQVQLQDEGSAMKYFSRVQGGSWRLVASDGFPRDARGCAAIAQIPRSLAAAWSNCPLDVG